MSYDGKWVCVDKFADNYNYDNCIYYGYKKRCLKCKDKMKLLSNGMCVETCPSSRSQVDIYNGIENVAGCAKRTTKIFEDNDKCAIFMFSAFDNNDEDSTCF